MRTIKTFLCSTQIFLINFLTVDFKNNCYIFHVTNELPLFFAIWLNGTFLNKKRKYKYLNGYYWISFSKFNYKIKLTLEKDVISIFSRLPWCILSGIIYILITDYFHHVFGNPGKSLQFNIYVYIFFTRNNSPGKI